mgnify:CR=1 FL=1
MVTVTLAALGIVAGVPVPLVAAGWVAAVHPMIALTGIASYAAWRVWRKRRTRSGPDDEAGFLQSLSAELTGGASLRSALVAAAARSERLSLLEAARAAAVGMPASRVAASLRSALPVNGRMTAAAWLLAADSGGPAASGGTP